jgi:hypothetical protein
VIFAWPFIRHLYNAVFDTCSKQFAQMSAFRAKADMLGDPLEKYVHALQKKPQ